MFDDVNQQPNNQKTANNNYPQDRQNTGMPNPSQPATGKEPEDIFAGTDKSTNTPKPRQFQPKQNINPAVTSQPNAQLNDQFQPQALSQDSQPNGKQNKKYIIIGAVAIVALALILVSMIALAYFKAQETDVQTTNENMTDNSVNNENAAVDNNIIMEEDIVDDSINSDNTENMDNNQDNLSGNDSSVLLEEITDTDGDGLMDGEEKRLGTSITSSDTDNDGLFDRQEIRIYNTDPINPDTDGDGFIDGEEVDNGYNPNGEGKLYELP